jgi:hypothetical protein
MEVSVCPLEERANDVLVYRAGQVQVQLLVYVPAGFGPVTSELGREVGNTGQHRRMRRNLDTVLQDETEIPVINTLLMLIILLMPLLRFDLHLFSSQVTNYLYAMLPMEAGALFGRCATSKISPDNRFKDVRVYFPNAVPHAQMKRGTRCRPDQRYGAEEGH